MDAAALKAQQAPLKNAYRETPEKALITLRARGSIDDQAIACKVETGRAIAVAGLHPATGGSGLELCSGDMLLEALVACAGVTLKAVATALEFRLDGASVSAEGDLDFRGTLGVAKDAPVGFRAIRLAFELATDEPQERIDSLLKLTERYCVVFQTINQRPELSVTRTQSLTASAAQAAHRGRSPSPSRIPPCRRCRPTRPAGGRGRGCRGRRRCSRADGRCGSTCFWS